MAARKKARKTKKTRKTKAKRVKKAKRRPAKAAKRKVAKKKPAKKKVAKKAKVARPTASGRVKKVAKAKPIGKVVHFYDRISVAIVELKAPLKVGDRVILKRGSTLLKQRVASMQIEHTPITLAKRGDTVGMKVDKPVKQGSVVLAA